MFNNKKLAYVILNLAIVGSFTINAQANLMSSATVLSQNIAEQMLSNPNAISTQVLESIKNDFLVHCDLNLSEDEDLLDSNLKLKSEKAAQLMKELETQFIARFESKSGLQANSELRNYAKVLAKAIVDTRNHARRMNHRKYSCSESDSTMLAISTRLESPLADLTASGLLVRNDAIDTSAVTDPTNLNNLQQNVLANSSSKFRYAGKGPITKRRMHPSEVDGLPFVRKVPQIKVKGLGFALGGKEVVFKNVVKMMSTSYHSSGGKTGYELIKAMESYTKTNGCIPRMLLAAHGYGSKLSGNHRESLARTSTWRDEGKGFYRTGSGPTIEGTLKSKVDSGAIKFCGGCEIFMHACSITHEFSKSFARVSGCNVVSANFKVSPVSPTHLRAIENPVTSRRSYPNIGEYEQVWFTSGNGNFHEYLPNGEYKVIGQSFVMDPDFIQSKNLILK